MKHNYISVEDRGESAPPPSPTLKIPTKLKHLRSPIGYPGSKAKVVRSLFEAMPTDWTEFRDPFAGGLSFSLHLMAKFPQRKFWINDLDPSLSCFWRVLANESEQLGKTLTHYLLEYPSDEDKVCLCEWAKGLISETEGADRAALFYVMAKTSFSTLAYQGTCAHPWRFNAKGIESLLLIGRFLRTINLTVTDLDYRECLATDPNIFSYFDPPYSIESPLYGQNGELHRNFDHYRFAQTVLPLRSRWMLSYNDDLLIRHYFRTKHISKIEIQYVMATKRKATEILITNYEH